MNARTLLLTLGLALLAGCGTRQPAPVADRSPPPVAPVVEDKHPLAAPPVPATKPSPTHVVKRGDTLVSIALQYGLDYRELAAWNNIVNVNVISVGQVLVLAPPQAGGPAPAPGAIVATPLATPGALIEARPLANTPELKVEPRGQKLPYSDKALAQLSGPDSGGPGIVAAPPVAAPFVPPPAAPVAPVPPPAAPSKATVETDDVEWMWPVKGKVLSAFTEATKGVDIAGRKGAPVLAAAAGRVVYAGAGLRGYGKLVIIKHNNTWLSAYAHNDNIVVKEQQDVKRGQKIAEMGSTDTDQVKLHFEVRKQGKPVDPAKVLPAS